MMNPVVQRDDVQNQTDWVRERALYFENLNGSKSQNSSERASNDGESEFHLVQTAGTSAIDQSEDAIIIDDSLYSIIPLDTSMQSKITQNSKFEKLVIAHLVSIKEHLVRLEAKIDHQRPMGTSSQSRGIIDVTKLAKFDIPVDSEEKLRVLDKNLKDENYRNDLVSTIECKYISTHFM